MSSLVAISERLQKGLGAKASSPKRGPRFHGNALGDLENAPRNLAVMVGDTDSGRYTAAEKSLTKRKKTSRVRCIAIASRTSPGFLA